MGVFDQGTLFTIRDECVILCLSVGAELCMKEMFGQAPGNSVVGGHVDLGYTILYIYIYIYIYKYIYINCPT